MAVELCEQASPKRVLIHFVNYNAEETLENVQVKIRFKSGRPSRVRLLSPDPAGDKSLKIRGKDGQYSFTLPKLKIYAVAVIEGASVQ
ncbi:MAG: hypothetical protein BWY73_00923 [candidate division TA06 bacterium ADurb.Bin417]|uniref:Glycosyl hydrolases family 38 C-terminal beta sandwich domain-containing protein n=1 Tax=candidate division TA06 bacterium ADurb.Bin417 TaxID=1852828 RepID=A0A1V5MG05_UNCT6|nr:MAG: hypothetical protein BWY73_00923 [candidate division TA06 bacterium ADurb.Bin417]